MIRNKHFNLENLLMSVAGHLAVVAMLITSMVVIINRAQLVAPDRIEIIEIDLNNVKISMDETKLQNTNADMAPEVKKEEQKPVAKPEVEPEKIEEKPIEEPTLVEEEKPEPEKPKEEKKPEPVEKEKKVEPAPAPKKKRVVRVNREVMSLDRTMNVSVVDALRVAMTRCWVVDTTRSDVGDIRAVAHLTMRRNGTVRDVWFESAARAESDPAFAYVLETIRDAINTCQPLNMLPTNEFNKWEKIQLTFYPTSGKVM